MRENRKERCGRGRLHRLSKKGNSLDFSTLEQKKTKGGGERIYCKSRVKLVKNLLKKPVNTGRKHDRVNQWVGGGNIHILILEKSGGKGLKHIRFKPENAEKKWLG